MISLFTTAKSFLGRNATNQINALRSWKASGLDVEIMVFGPCQGIDDVSRELGIIRAADVPTSETGVPLIGGMFEMASRRASHEVCCFVNADIILPRAFFDDVLSIHATQKQGYLIVGQREDVDIDAPVSFEGDWESNFRRQYGAQITEHPPYGSDFFVFPSGQFLEGVIPRLLVGRPGWDLWMIFHARRAGIKTIDLSYSTKVIHQNHDYGHKDRQYEFLPDDPEAQINLSHLPRGNECHFTLLACDYHFQDGQLKRNFARGDFHSFVKIERALGSRVSLRHLLKARMQRLSRSLTPRRWLSRATASDR